MSYDLHTHPGSARHARLFELLRQNELARKPAPEHDAISPQQSPRVAATIRPAMNAIEALRDKALGSFARS